MPGVILVMVGVASISYSNINGSRTSLLGRLLKYGIETATVMVVLASRLRSGVRQVSEE